MRKRTCNQFFEAADHQTGSIALHLWQRFAALIALSAAAVVCAIAVSQWCFPTLPKETRKESERLARQIDSPTISFASQFVLEQQLERLAVATKSRAITNEQCKAGIEAIHYTVIEYSLTQGLVKSYIDRSTLTNDERTAAAQTLRRYAAALFSGKVNEATAAEIEDRAREANTDSGGRFRETLPDAELHDLIAAMEKAADTAAIAADLPPIDVCAEVRRIVDRQLRLR